jgi:hypothetical protein
MAESFVFFGAVHVVQVLLVPQRLEIAADEKQVELDVDFVLQAGELMVDFLSSPWRQPYTATCIRDCLLS